MVTRIKRRIARWWRTLRQTEFTLLCIVALYTAAGMLLTHAGLSLTAYDRVVLHDWTSWASVALAFIALLFLANLVIFPALEFDGDQLLLPLVGFLCATSLLVVTFLQPALFRRGVYLYELATYQGRPDYTIELFNAVPYLSREEFADLNRRIAGVNAANQAVRDLNTCASDAIDDGCPPVVDPITWQIHLHAHFSTMVVGLVALLAIVYDPPHNRPPWFRRPAASLLSAALVAGVLALTIAQRRGAVPRHIAPLLGLDGVRLLMITALVLAARYLNEETIRRPWLQVAALTLGALALLGAVVTNSLTIPLIGIQVSELLKLLLVVFFAGFGSRIAIKLRGTDVRRQLRLGLLLMAVFGIAALGMILLRDLGAILVLTTILTAYLFLLLPSKTAWPLLLVTAGLVIGLGFVGYYVLPTVGVTHVRARLDLWLDPWTRQGTADGEQLIQAFRALKYGGLVGQGLGQGRSYVIPVAESDLVLPVFIEQTGWLGGLLVLGVYLTLLLRGFRIAATNERLDRVLLAAGLTALLGFQTFIILAGSLGALPLTGITVPFISMGGSAMLMNFAYVGLLLRLSPDDPASGSRSIPYDTREIRKTVPHLAALSLLLFAYAVIGGAARIYRHSAALAAPTEPYNPWVQVELERTLRGAILDRHGNPIAESVARGGDRIYPDPLLATSLAQTIGYHSSRYGSAGLELAFDERLTGQDPRSPLVRTFARLRYLLTREIDGRDIRTTIDPDLQKMVYGLMRDPDRVHNAGAALLLEPRTGEIRALVSVPTFNPATIDAEYARLTAAEGAAAADAPFLNRVTQGAYAPGSVFKVLTAAAALEQPTFGPNGTVITPETLFTYALQPPPGPAGYTTYWHRNDCATTAAYHGLGTFDFEHALAYSDNVVFAEVGQAIGPYRFREAAARFGIGEPLEIGIPVRASTLSRSADYLASACGLAQTAFGQGELQLTPLQVGLIGAAVANDGRLAAPHLVTTPAVKDRDRQVLDARTAAQVRAMLVTVVEDELGSGSPARIPGVQVAGKTGTAETAGAPHAWFVGFAPADAPRYLVVVVLENQGEGSRWAAPLARDILAGALGVAP